MVGKTITTGNTALHVENEKGVQRTALMGFLDRQAELYKEHIYGAIPMMLIFHCCLASIAAAMALEVDNVLLLTLVTVATMGCNAMIIAQAKAKICVTMFYISFVTSAVVIGLLGFGLV